MGRRLTVLRRAKAALRSRWVAFAALGLTAGTLLATGMRIQAETGPSLEPLFARSSTGPQDWTVWVLFQRLDCVSSRWKIEAWDELAADGRIRVIGMALDSPEGWPEEMDPVARLAVSFQVLPGPSPAVSRALRALGVSVTPAALVVDRAGRLRSVVPGDAIRSPEHIQEIVENVAAVDL